MRLARSAHATARTLACALALLLAASPALPDEAAHLVGNERPQELIDSFGGALERRLPHGTAARGAQALPLPAAAAAADFSYAHEGRRLRAADYPDRQRVTGLLVIKDGAIVLEQYRHGRGPHTRFLSASVAKSVIGLLVGIAVQEGAIKSLDDPARAYVPALAGNPYGETPVRELLRMSSGVAFRENYDNADDLARLIRDTIGQRSPGGPAVLLPYRERRVPPGRLFYYASADTQALALVLRGATGMPVAEYLGTRLWGPMGAEDTASFLVDAAGQEAGYAFMHARLRDFARLGWLLANDGRIGERQLVPAQFLRGATQVSGPHAQPGVASAYFGYGEHFWIFPGTRRQFAMLGVRGQAVFVDPELKLVLVQTAVWNTPGDRVARAELLALWRGLVAHYGGTPPP